MGFLTTMQTLYPLIALTKQIGKPRQFSEKNTHFIFFDCVKIGSQKWDSDIQNL